MANTKLPGEDARIENFTPPFSMGRYDGRGGRSFRPGRKNGFRDKNGKGNTYRERSQGNFGKRGGKARVAIFRYVLEYQKSNMHVPTCDHQSATTVNGHDSDVNSSSCRPNVDYREQTTNKRNANQEIKPDRVDQLLPRSHYQQKICLRSNKIC